MSIREKIKTADNKIEQNKVRFNLYRQTATISALSSENVRKYEFLTGKDVLPEKNLIEKVSASRRIGYSGIVKKQYQILGNTYEFDRIKKEKPTIKKYNRSNLIYNDKFSFYEYYNISFNSLSLTSKFKVLISFYIESNKFIE